MADPASSASPSPSPLPPPPLAPPISSSVSISEAIKPLRRAVSLRHEARSAVTMWMPRSRDVQLEFALDQLTVVAMDQSKKRDAIPWQDVLGAHLLNEDGDHLAVPVDPTTVATSKTYVFALFAYPAKHTKPGKLKKRQLREWLFRFPGTEMADLVLLTKWVNFLADPRSHAALASVNSLEELTPRTWPNRKFLVIINPVGGAGKGLTIYENKVANLFKLANIDTEVKLTERAAHGVDIAATLPLGKYDCVVAVGGDGSLAEIFQGLMKRDDWKQAIRQPLGIIPGGSGNGLFSSLMHELGEHFKPGAAAYVLAKGLPHPLDLTAVRNPHGECMYSFLSSEWALVADIDVESEKLRAIGSARFTVTTLQHVFLKSKTYEGEVWYLDEQDTAVSPVMPHNADEGSERPGFELFSNLEDGANASDGSAAKWKKLSGGFHLVWVMNLTHAAGDAMMAPGAGLNDGYNYLVLMDGTHPRKELVSLFLAMESGKHVENPTVQFIKTRAFKIVPSREDDLICVDGEVFNGPIEAQVHHNVARIITLPRATSCHVYGA